MNKRYVLLAIIAICLGLGMLFMPGKDQNKYSDRKNNAKTLLASIDDPSRFLSADDITDRLVKKDPALLLIDVRPEAQFKAYAIPGAVNIPIDSLLNSENLTRLKQEGKNKVFYSNSGTLSDGAWILAKREGITHVFVLKDGINNWFNNIVKAEKPSSSAPSEAFDLYNFRVAACQYFYGTGQTKANEKASIPQPKKTVVVKKVAASSGGGC